MNSKRVIRLLLLLLSMHPIMSQKPFILSCRFALGPAWHNFFSYESFILTEEATRLEETPQTEFLDTEFQPMFYAEGLMKARICDYAQVVAYAGGGHFSKGQSGLNYLITIEGISFPTPFLRPIKLSGAVAIFDIYAAPAFSFCKKRYSLNPLVGYTFNREKLKLAIPESVVRYSMNNHWKGPYIGIEGSLAVTQKFLISAWYKFVFAHVQSQYNLLTPPFDPQTFPIFRVIPDAPFSRRCANAHGNLFNVQAQYHCSEKYTIGSSLTYLHYKNHCPGSVRFAPENVHGVAGAILNKIFWQQLMWTFFIEVTF